MQLYVCNLCLQILTSNPHQFPPKYFLEFSEITYEWLLIFLFSFLPLSLGCCHVDHLLNLLGSPTLPHDSTVSIPSSGSHCLSWTYHPSNRPAASAVLIQEEHDLPSGCYRGVVGNVSFSIHCEILLGEHQSNVTWLISIKGTRNRDT